MPSQRMRKLIMFTYVLKPYRKLGQTEDELWNRMPAVGREFGSPDHERLMAEDQRLGIGVLIPQSWKSLRS